MPSEYILDLFGGSGSMSIAAEQRGGVFLMELDPGMIVE
jgi:16S rRNA G966 N2-methylase RsmD